MQCAFDHFYERWFIFSFLLLFERVYVVVGKRYKEIDITHAAIYVKLSKLKLISWLPEINRVNISKSAFLHFVKLTSSSPGK